MRGINVGGHRKLPMKTLVPIFEGHGCQRVSTYIQSGNVVFEAKAAVAKRIPKLVAKSIADDFGFDVPVVMRSAAELRETMNHNPFMTKARDPKTLHVAFLSAKPLAAAIAALDPERSPPDRLHVRGREVYLLLPNGVGRTKISNDYLEARLGVGSTLRNWRTVSKLALMLG